ncbi:MAG: hypothetical protein OEO77_13840 [Acidimicrobiia bacterium]|nr:hypothetical protein [Acidimicrobiia bacterium]
MQDIFGPLNGVRVGLVAAAAGAAILGAILGQWAVTAVLGAGVAVHGFGWVWMYRRHQRS